MSNMVVVVDVELLRYVWRGRRERFFLLKFGSQCRRGTDFALDDRLVIYQLFPQHLYLVV